MKSSIILPVSLFINLALAGLALFYFSRKINFHYKKEAPYTYNQNAYYGEQIDFQRLYATKAKIVMLGNSMISRLQWNELLKRNDVINRGISSDITEGFLKRVKYVLNTNPAVCFIEGGINDLTHGIPEGRILQNLDKLVNVLSANNVKPVLHTVLQVAYNYPGQEILNKKISTLNQRIRNLASQKGIVLIDLNPALATRGILSRKYAQEDGIHLKAAAYIIWKNEVEKVLNQFQL